MGNSIPEAARTTVKQRGRFRCGRCGVPTPRGEVHHRRSRLVRDEHQHCPCNLIYLCSTCHRWVHDHPFEARGVGLIMSKFIDEPFTVPQASVRGLTYYSCDGGSTT